MDPLRRPWAAALAWPKQKARVVKLLASLVVLLTTTCEDLDV